MKDKDIIKGFNQGYMLHKHRPELAEKLVKGMEGQKSDYIAGFVKGSEEWQKEKSKDKYKSKETPKEIKLNYRLKERDLPKKEKDRTKGKGKER